MSKCLSNKDVLDVTTAKGLVTELTPFMHKMLRA